MLRVKAGRSFAVRKVSPTFRFAEPLPTVLDIERRALATQQLHITTAYRVVHGHLPELGCPHPTPAHAEVSLNRCDPFESALQFLEEATVPLTDVERGCGFLEIDGRMPTGVTNQL